MSKYEITKGSIADIMKNENVSLAESFMSCDCIVIFDVSGSMTAEDGADGKTRFDRGVEQLREIQATMPGNFAIVQFADRVDFMPGGVPVMGISGGLTNLTKALQFVEPADSIPDMRFIIISDGEPDNEVTAMNAAKRFRNRIDTIFIGREDETYGRTFLQNLAAASGGKSMQTAAENIRQDIVYLLAAGQ